MNALDSKSEETSDEEDEKRSTDDTDSDTADRPMKTTPKRRKTSL